MTKFNFAQSLKDDLEAKLLTEDKDWVTVKFS